MAAPTNGGVRGSVSNVLIRDLYRHILDIKNPGAEVFRLTVLGYTQPAAMVAYGQRNFQYTVDGVQHTFVLPRMTYIGYTDKEFDWIDSFYGALVRRLESGDVEFMTSAAMQELGSATVVSREIWSLRGPAGIGGGASDPNGSKGLGPNVPNGDMLQETIVISEDLVAQRRTGAGRITEARYRAEFVSRVFHEMLHRNWVHNTYAYDTQRSLVENMRAGFDIDDMQALDRVYGETKNVLLDLASSDPALGLSSSEITKVWDETTRGALRNALDYRTAQIYRRAHAELADGDIDFTRADLDYMESEGLIELKDYPPEVTTREQKEAFKNKEENYQVDRGYIRRLPKERQEALARLNVSAVAEGGMSLSEAVDVALEFAGDFFANYSSVIGRELGSALGRYLLSDENQATQLAGSTLLSVIGQNLGQIVELQLRGASGAVSTAAAFDDFDVELGQAGVGAISSFLTAELFNELGLEGTLAELGQSLFAQQLSNIVVAIATNTSVVNALNLANVGQLVGGLVGTKLAAELVEFDTIGGQIGAAVGAAVGATAGAKLGLQYGSTFGPIGAAIGAFVGYILGGLIGSIFGGTPRSGADVGWNGKEFAITGAWSASGGSKEAAISIATTVAELINGVITATGSQVADANQIRIGTYGMRKKSFVYWASGGPEDGQETFRTRSATEIINHGAAIALYDLLPRLVGGNVFVKRAVAATVAQAGGNPASNHGGAAGAFDMNVLLGNISSAQDYAGYLANKEQIDILLAAQPDSAFTAGWTITLARAIELGLNKRASVDWAGGWNVFLDQSLDGVMDGVGFTGAQLQFTVDPADQGRIFAFFGGEGELANVFGDTIDNALKDRIVGSAQADTIVVNADRIAATTGLTINGAAASGGEHIIRIAASIDGGGGNDVIVAGDLGNDLSGGNGDDTLVGGKLDDWLIGDAGNDRLFAGAANHQFVDSDATAIAAALNTISNGDMLDGGEGDDVLYGSRGSDWLRGGVGVDTIYGGAGGDIIDGGAGNDSGANRAPRLFGGGGTDQYVFGYGSGLDSVFDEADGLTPGAAGQDSLYTRVQQIASGAVARNWAGGGEYEVDGSVKGGEDAIAFAPGIGMRDLIMQRAGQDLIIKLTYEDPTTGVRGVTGDELTVKDWFESTRRVEWLRFADGEDVRIGDITSFIVGTGASDVIVGTNEADFLYGDDGNDLMYGLAGDDFGFGGNGNDLVSGDNDNDWVAGGQGVDKVIGGAGNDTVFGDAGNDDVYGGSGADIVAGGRGDDLVVGGGGNDIFRYSRGDGQDTFIDEYVNNWEVVWSQDQYLNGYTLNAQNGTVTKNGQTFYDGEQWLGLYDYDDTTRSLRRHLGPVNGAMAANAGADYIEFGVGIDVQDLMFRQSGDDLQIAILPSDGDGAAFDDVADRITLRNWWLASRPIENFVFAATGRHVVTGTNINGGGEGADVLNGVGGADWFTGGGGDDTLNGNGGDDVLSGNSGADSVRGHAGNDVLYGGSGNDMLDGGAGADTLIGGDDADIASYATATGSAIGMRAFIGAARTNTRDGAGDTYVGIEGLEGTSGNDVLGGDAGENTLRGLAGNDTLYGGAGGDTYEFNINHGVDTIRDQPFATEEILDASGALNTALFTATWTMTGMVGDETLGYYTYYYQLVVTRNGSGEEVYRSGLQDFSSPSPMSAPPSGTQWPTSGWLAGSGLAMTPTVTGNGAQVVREVFENASGGDDTLEFGADISLSDLTFQRVNGGADLQITYRSGHSVTIVGQNDVNRAIETLQLRDGLSADLTRLVLVGETATSAGDLLIGDGSANTLQGLGGDDVISGGVGADTLLGGEGNDQLEGGSEGDTLDGGNDSVSAGLQPDEDDPAKTFGDTIRYIRSNAAVTIDLAAGTASGGHAGGDVIVMSGGVSTIENVTGADLYGDTLRGDGRANRLFGLGGNDTIDGRGGADVLIGGLGNDTLSGGDGEDNLAGEAGDDTLNGGNDNDVLAGGEGNDSLFGDAGEDLLSGGSGDDIVRGGAQNDRLGGDAGVDQLYGEAGADQLAGGEGNDFLYGGDGNDVLDGEAGNDQLSGDAGDDTYAFSANSGSDVIVDAAGANRIAFTGVTREQVWMTRSGNDLRIAVIGGTSVITVQNYYATSSATLVREIALDSGSLFTAYAGPLIAEMTAWSQANGNATPTALPATIGDLLDSYWHSGGKAVPTVVDQTLTTNEDVALSGNVGAIDHDGDIVSYAIEEQPTFGAVTLNATTGAWTYTPAANQHGQDRFEIVVTDANNKRAVQTVVVNVVSINDAPSDIALTGTLQIEERDHPPAGTVLTPIVLGTLSATDVDFPDAGDFDDHVFTVSDSRFEIVNGATLRLRAGVALDFEATPTIALPITVTDRNGAGLSFTRTFTFTILNRDDYFYGTSGNDTLTGQSGRNLMYGYAGNDTLTGGGANDDLDGGDGNDQLYGQGGNDLLLGGLGDDTLDGGLGDDIIRGNVGTDTLIGGDGNDQLYGENGEDLLQGGLGNDQLDGGSHNDRIEGGAGNDRLVGGDGDDLLIGGAGADRFLGGNGIDTISYETATAGVIFNVTTTVGSAGDAAGDYSEGGVENIVGSAFNDRLTGGSGNGTFYGGAGDDIIYGGGGNDRLFGGEGNDTLDAESGNDTLDGGVGNDTLIGGDDSDTYLLDINSGADVIQNYDPNGADIDVLGYQGITSEQLWFERSGNDMIVSVIGTGVRTTIRDWYLIATANDRANYKIDFILAGERVTQTIDAEALVTLMSGYTRPTTQAAFDTLRATPSFNAAWAAAWQGNAGPDIPVIANQTINEDGSVSLSITITDDITPAAGVTVVARAVRPDDYDTEDLTIVTAPTVGAPNAAGTRTLTVNSRANASGQVAIQVNATDAGGVVTSRVFLLTIAAVADVPVVTLASVATPTTPLTKPTLDSGSWGINLQAALTDQDGSETLEVHIANVPSGLSFSSGSLRADGVWVFTADQLPGLRLQGPATWSQDLSLSVTAVSRETSTGQTATSPVTTLNVVINAAPTDIATASSLSFNENTAAGTTLATFTTSDADAGDTASYELLDNAGGMFALSANGTLTATGTPMDYETAPINPQTQRHEQRITVRVRDSGGLTRTEDFWIAINNVNEKPYNIRANVTGALTIAENSVANTEIAWITASDPENNIVNYSYQYLSGNNVTSAADGRLVLSSNGRLATGSVPLDYEATPTLRIRVTVTDALGATEFRDFDLNVGAVNEAPIFNASTLSFVRQEDDAGAGTIPGVIGQILASDPEGGAITYQLVGDPGPFGISSSGALSAHQQLSYEARPGGLYSLTVRATDNAGVSTDRQVTVQVTDRAEAPVFNVNAVTGTGASAPNRVATYAGTLNAFDPDGGPVTYEIVSVYAYYQVIDLRGGGISYLWSSVSSPSPYIGVSIDASGNMYATYNSFSEYLPTGLPHRINNHNNLHVNVRVRDSSGAISQTIGIRLSPSGGTPVVMPAWTPPVVLDLDGDGVELVPLRESIVDFRATADAAATRTGWIGADDAVLALDRNGDGAITHGGEISFVQDLPGAQSDLEGLAAFDTDHDGSFDADDARFGEFRLWQDANQDGVSQAEELKSLAEHGITSISLERSPTGQTTLGATDNIVLAMSVFTRSDGSTGEVGDVVLASDHNFVDPDEEWSIPSDSGSTPIDEFFRGAREAQILEAEPVSVAAPQVLSSGADEFSRADSATAAQKQASPARRRPWRLSDLDEGATAGAMDMEQSYAVSPAQPSALHASLDSVVRRRLQMIEAMAAFAPEGASMLELQPSRKVDARTLELLTSVPEVRVM